ncbi:MAG: GNAT family N-acetyltransferase [Nitrospira sp.]
MADSTYLLISVSAAEHWTTYHSLRRSVLCGDRGLVGCYDSNHPDDRKVGNHPVLLTCDGVPVGAMRIDLVAEQGFAIMRTIAITSDRQRRGYGRIMLSLAEEYASNNGFTATVVFAAHYAIEFYIKCGYEPHTWDPKGCFGSGSQMRKILENNKRGPTP